jgi:hypothetical protein
MLEQIKGKSLNKLEDLMGGFSWDLVINNVQDNNRDVGGDNSSSGVRSNSGDSNNYSQPYSASTSGCTTAITVSSGSVFMPSVDR